MVPKCGKTGNKNHLARGPADSSRWAGACGKWLAAPLGSGAVGDDATGRKIALLGNGMGIRVPAYLLQERHDELPACVGLGHGEGALGAWTKC